MEKESDLKILNVLAGGFLLVIISFLAFRNAPSGKFHLYDYERILGQERYKSPGNIPAFFKPRPEAKEFRPVLDTLNTINYAVARAFGNPGKGVNPVHDPRVWLWGNLLLHLATALAFYLLCHRIFPSFIGEFWPAFLVSLFAAIIFGIHPLASDPLSYVYARKYILVTLFQVLTAGAFLCARNSNHKFMIRGAAYLFSLAFLCLALLSKASALAVPLIIILLEVTVKKERNGETSTPYRVATGILRVLPFLAVSTGYILLFRGTLPTFHGTGLADNACIQIDSWAAYISNFLYPTGISLPRTYNVILPPVYPWPLGANLASTFVIIGLFMLFLASIAAFRKSPLFLVGLAWFFIALVPSSSVLPTMEPLDFGRAYVGLPGLAIAGTSLLVLLSRTLLPRKWNILLVFFALLLIPPLIRQSQMNTRAFAKMPGVHTLERK